MRSLRLRLSPQAVTAGRALNLAMACAKDAGGVLLKYEQAVQKASTKEAIETLMSQVAHGCPSICARTEHWACSCCQQWYISTYAYALCSLLQIDKECLEVVRNCVHARFLSHSVVSSCMVPSGGEPAWTWTVTQLDGDTISMLQHARTRAIQHRMPKCQPQLWLHAHHIYGCTSSLQASGLCRTAPWYSMSLTTHSLTSSAPRIRVISSVEAP